MKNSKEHGFSEIELVTFIVLVTVLVFMYSAGKDYYHQYKIKQDIILLTSYKYAIREFKDKYGELPGDFKNAKYVWKDCADNVAMKASCNGNGDGLWNYAEGMYVFEHLSRADMIDGIFRVPATNEDTILYPTLDITKQSIVPVGQFDAATQDNLSKVFFNYPMPTNSLMVYFESNTPNQPIPTQLKVDHMEVMGLDIKVDDGSGRTGNVRASFDRSGFFGSYPASELCTDNNGNYRKDEDNFYFCSFIMSIAVK